MARILVTGGAGFVGSAVIRHIVRETQHEVLNVDSLTYAGNLESLAEICRDSRYSFSQVDICDRRSLEQLFAAFRPESVLHLAAESHVDRSIDGPADFVKTNLVGSYTLLDVAKEFWQRQSDDERMRFRFLHVSTDEVYGDLGATDDRFTEHTAYSPSSPYSASKAGSDHLVRAWGRTYGLPILVTNCSNNYGPYQFPEKLIPHVILNALGGKRIPVYGDGRQVRNWIHVEDHARALMLVLSAGKVGETYVIGGETEFRNLSVIELVCDLMEELAPTRRHSALTNYRELIEFVADRPGHDVRYAVDAGKIRAETGWQPRENFAVGLRKTVQWYLDNEQWWQRVLSGAYRLDRIGVGAERKVGKAE